LYRRWKHVSSSSQIVKQYGFEAYRFLFTTLLSSINFYNITQKDKPKLQLLSQEFARLTTQTNFTSIILKAFTDGVENGLRVEFISQFSRTLNLPLSQQILLGIALAESHKSDVPKEGSFNLTSVSSQYYPSLQVSYFSKQNFKKCLMRDS